MTQGILEFYRKEHILPTISTSKTWNFYRPVNGFVLGGFHTNGVDSLKVNVKEIATILKDILPLLPGTVFSLLSIVKNTC